VVEFWLSSLKDSNEYFRARAAAALKRVSRTRPNETMKLLIPALNDDSPYLRECVITMLRDLGTLAVEALIRVLQQPEPCSGSGFGNDKGLEGPGASDCRN